MMMMMMMIIIIIIIIIIIRDNEKRTCMLIDVAIPGDRNVIKKEAGKILKYKDLTIEIQRMWNVKTRVIPVIIGVIGTISKSFRKYVSDIPGNHGINCPKLSHDIMELYAVNGCCCWYLAVQFCVLFLRRFVIEKQVYI